MADAPPTHLAGLEPLEERLSMLEPLCLALVVVEAPNPGVDHHTAASGPLLAAVGERLRGALRPYDELDLLPDGRFVVILPTLADRHTLAGRMDRVFQAVDAPYELGAEQIRVRALLGAAVRDPQDDTPTFLGRVVAAVEQARQQGGRAPILV